MYPDSQQYANAASPSAPKRGELLVNALDQSNKSLCEAINRIESSLNRLGYSSPGKDAKADGPKPVPQGVFGTLEEKLQYQGVLTSRLHDLCTVFEGFV